LIDVDRVVFIECHVEVTAVDFTLATLRGTRVFTRIEQIDLAVNRNFDVLQAAIALTYYDGRDVPAEANLAAGAVHTPDYLGRIHEAELVTGYLKLAGLILMLETKTLDGQARERD
jgi:hypothetical protein